MIENFNSIQNTEKPCLIDVGQGFSVLYRQRYLYSKYAPQKSILQTISEISILDESLILAFSPCLWYGIEGLVDKISEKSFIVGIEEDENLFNLALQKLQEIEIVFPKMKAQIFLCHPYEFENLIKKLPNLKRAISIEMSGGVFFNKDKYSNIFLFAQDFISSFWKNRVTLVKLGRLFCKNFFKNLKKNPTENPIPAHPNIFNRPFLIFGAGESAEAFIKKIDSKTLDRCTIFAVDAALSLLVKHKIKVDFAIAVEAQVAIEKAYIGLRESLENTILLSDLSSRPSIINLFNKTLYFYSEFDDAQFFKKLEDKKLLPPKITPLGSVGLTAVELALFMRKDEEVPIFVAGLDFSFSPGFTHARGTPAHIQRLINTNRLVPVENFTAAFKIDSKRVQGKNSEVITDTALLNYAKLFRGYFASKKNLFDAGEKGLSLNLPFASTQFIDSICKSIPPKKDFEFNCLFKTEKNDSISQSKKNLDYYLKNEIKSLNRIKELLSKGENANPKPLPSLEQELTNLLECREYLYLHFADGYKFSVKDTSILKRIRNEIDFFLKNLEA
ncbi:6-hydroxymethylpterin diphosphokinase MptE-like protein [Treponema pectinovorum]|uniref:6-hydroxymethylpterin diphosphokinase MptE-like protein n=1 Tax=Treponema pectinovorum TaxID=164 RepID=UPI0011C7FC74|nr:6-hydroxymethylpterin diphosphokinase MptE-like protein [Treponema pectinovorum]